MSTRKTPLLKLLTRNLFRRVEFFIFLLKNLLSERHFLYVACVLVALSCSLAVVVLKTFAHQVFVIAQSVNSVLNLPYLNTLLPIIGILLTIFVVRNVLNGELETGSSRILYAIAKKNGILPRKQMYAQIITSSLTVGLGGSAGLESPITITGAAFGSNFAQQYHLSRKNRVLLLGCGVAAGIATAFNAPIAGVLFAIEVVLTEVSIGAFIPIIIAAATGALMGHIILSQDILLDFSLEKNFSSRHTPFYILLGVLAGFISVFHARQFRRVESWMSQLKLKGYRRGLFGALLLSVLLFFFPTLFGEGYESIKTLATAHPEELLSHTLLDPYKSKQWVLILFVGATLLIKSIATGLTLGSGGNGGNFAPSLFVGSYLGFVVAKTVNYLHLTHPLPVTHFALAGMAGILSGLFHAPLTAIFLICEITGGYDLMVPLMIVSSVSFAVSRQFEKHSMDVKSLADKGEVYTQDKDRNILQSIEVQRLVVRGVKTMQPSQTVEEVVQLFSTNAQRLIPIVDDKQILLGIIDFERVKTYLFNPYRVKFMNLNELVTQPEEVLLLQDPAEVIMKQFEESGKDCLPVLDKGIFYGLLYKVDVLENYRKRLNEMVID
jgi:CIC family chloride channel protein